MTLLKNIDVINDYYSSQGYIMNPTPKYKHNGETEVYEFRKSIELVNGTLVNVCITAEHSIYKHPSSWCHTIFINNELVEEVGHILDSKDSYLDELESVISSVKSIINDLKN